MGAELTDRGVRLAMRMGLELAARFAGVARGTLYTYEIGPSFVSAPKRERCERFFTALRLALQILQALENHDGKATSAVPRDPRSR